MQIDLKQGNSLEVLKTFADNSIDSIVTDPPYLINFMSKKWDAEDNVAGSPEIWRECLRVIKPGGHLAAFSHSRTHHRVWCAIEDAGWEIRDTLMWLYGSGFPKSHNIGKSYDKKMGNEREVLGTKADFSRDGCDRKTNPHQTMQETMNADITVGYKDGWNTPVTAGTSIHEGWGTALKPAVEPIVLARKPLSEKTIVDNVIKWGTGGINIDGSRVAMNGEKISAGFSGDIYKGQSMNSSDTQLDLGAVLDKTNTQGRFPANVITDGSPEVLEGFPINKSTSAGNNYKGSWQPGDTAQSDTGRPSTTPGGYDDGDDKSAARFFYCAKVSKKERNAGLDDFPVVDGDITGQAARRLHCKKCGGRAFGTPHCSCEEPDYFTKDNVKNNHPTVKPVALMAYLCKLITPVGGTILDPFMGSGSTGMAAKQEGFNFTGIDLDEAYVEIAQARIDAWK